MYPSTLYPCTRVPVCLCPCTRGASCFRNVSGTPTMFERNRSCLTLYQTFSGLIAHLRLSCVHSSATAWCLLHPPGPFEPNHLPSTRPCQFERNRPCSTPTVSNSNAIARLLPPPRLFEADHSSPTSTESIRAQLLVSHLHHVLSSPIACLHPHHVNPSPTARLPPPPRQFERNRSCPTTTVRFRARPLVSHLHHTLSSPLARLPPPPCQLEPERASTTSIRARPLVCHPHWVNLVHHFISSSIHSIL